MNHKTLAVISIVSLITLSACGGGGGGSSSKSQPSPMPLSINASSTTLNANELEPASTSISLTNANGTVTTSNDYSGNGSVATTINGNEIEVIFTAPDLENNKEESFSISVSDADETKSLTFTATITNTSGEELASNISVIKAALEQQHYFDEISHVFTTYNKMAVLTNVYSQAVARSNETEFNNAVDSAQTSITTNDITPESIQSAIDNYHANTLTETELAVTLNDAITLLNEQSQLLLSSINSIANQSDKLPQLPELNYQVNTSLSPFIGNTLYGDWVDNVWEYKDDFSIIESALTSTCLAQ